MVKQCPIQPNILIIDYRRFLAGKMLTELVCYSATPEFYDCADELAQLLGVRRTVAGELLLPVSKGIVDVVEQSIPGIVKG